ncbi:MAG: creatininase family protein [Gemmatimonadota bacterium]|nr:creatininase family protein [Gemmatimonadota bacterium]
MPERITLEHMTSPEVAAALAAGYTKAIVPAGAVEQHGPHLPMFMDAAHGDRLGVEVARRLGGALVAPTIRVGCSEHHMAFTGTLTLERDTFLAVCGDYAASLARHGFTRVCFVPTHGGNFAPLRDGLDRLNEAAGDACSVEAYTDLMEVIDTWRDVAEREAGFGERVGGHADLAETSVMLALHPELVREELATAGYSPDPDPAAREALVERIIAEGFATVTPNGILGDARGGTAELGEKLIAALADVVAAAFGAA